MSNESHQVIAREAATKFLAWESCGPKGLSVDEMRRSNQQQLEQIILSAIERSHDPEELRHTPLGDGCIGAEADTGEPAAQPQRSEGKLHYSICQRCMQSPCQCGTVRDPQQPPATDTQPQRSELPPPWNDCMPEPPATDDKPWEKPHKFVPDRNLMCLLCGLPSKECRTQQAKDDRVKEQGWTPQMLSRLFDAECSTEEAINRICAKHESEMKCEREKREQSDRLWAATNEKLSAMLLKEQRSVKEQGQGRDWKVRRETCGWNIYEAARVLAFHPLQHEIDANAYRDAHNAAVKELKDEIARLNG
jgi:hypothetical protein